MRGPEEFTKTVRIGHSIKWMAANYHPPHGINIVVKVPDLANASDETICKFISNALNPTFPRYRGEIEQEINTLKVIEDRIRSAKDWKKVNSQKGKTETIIDSIQDDLEDTQLDHQIKRATQTQYLDNGKKLIRIWGRPD